MFQAEIEDASEDAESASNNADEALLRLGREFEKIDRRRVAQNTSSTVAHSGLIRLDRRWWRLVRLIIDTPANTAEGRRVVATVLAAVVRDVEHPEGEMERCAMALADSVIQ